MKQVLFVCTGNTCRSPMAEGILSDILDKKGIKNIISLSAGIYALEGQKVSDEALKVLKKEGIDISSHKAKQVDRKILEESDLILTMTRNHKEILKMNFPFINDKIYTLKEYAYGIEEDIYDPYGRGLKAYEHAKEEIKKAIMEKIK